MPTTEETKPVILELISTEEFTSMPVLLDDGQQRLLKASAIVKDFPAVVDDETDKNAAALIGQLELRMNGFNGSRMPFTRKLGEIVKKFTGVENGFQTLIDTMKKKRDAYAAAEVKKARDKQATLDADLAVKQAKIDLEGRYREVLRSNINAMLDNVRSAAGKLTNEVTAENIAESKKKLSKEPRWVPEKMDAFYYTPPAWVTDKEGYAAIAKEEFPANEKDYLDRSKQILKDSLAIIEVALTDKDEALRLQELAVQEDQTKATEDSDELQRDLEGQKIIAKIDMEEVVQPKAKVKMKIEILDDEAWVQIFANWWKWDTDKESEKLEKKTLLQMKTFVEKHANSNGEFIEHPSLTYIEDIKAK